MGHIEVGMEVRSLTKKKHSRTVVGMYCGFVYLRRTDDPWKVDVCMIQDFWDLYRLVDDRRCNYGRA